MRINLQIGRFLGGHHGLRPPPEFPAIGTERPIDDWMAAKTGKGIEQITTRDLLEIPRRRGLSYAPMESALGGRLDRHLRHLSDDEAADLQRRGDEFLAATRTDDLGPTQL